MIPRRIVAFGSSSVYGLGDPEGGGFAGRLRRWHESTSRKNCVYNLGVNGDTMIGMVSRFINEVSYRHPDIIVLYTGLNDIRRTGSREVPTMTSPGNLKEAMKQLLILSQKLAPTIYISPFPLDETRTVPFTNSQTYYLANDARAVTAMAQGLCEDLAIAYLPNFETSVINDYPSLSFDGLHGSPQAHEDLFLKLRGLLESLFT